MDKSYKKMNFADESGFTLMELIVVIGIIIILIALLLPKFSGMTDKANAAAVQNDARIGLTALSSYVVGLQGANQTPNGTTAIKQIYQALGSDNGTGPVDGITVTSTDGTTATFTETRGGLQYTTIINANTGKIQSQDCTGDKGRCDALRDSGLLYAAPNGGATTPNN